METRCQVCDSLMREEINHFETHTEYRWVCPKRHAHGDMQGIPRQWRGVHAVNTMRMLNSVGKGVWSVKLQREVPWPV